MPILSLRPLAGNPNEIILGRRVKATVVRGLTISGNSTLALAVGRRQKATTVRGVIISNVPVPPVFTPPPSGVFAITSCGSVASELYEYMRPLAYADDENDDALWMLCCSIAGMLQDIDDLSRDDGEIPGWGKLVDVNATPNIALNWLGQMVGVAPLEGSTDAQQRSRILAKEGFDRGSPAAMRAAAQLYLGGNKTVNFYERDTSPYHLSVSTYANETPEPAKVQAALLSQKPAGVILSYFTVPGQTYAQLLANHATYTLVNSYYSNYNEVLTDQP